MKIRLGTRGSQLALWQANTVKNLLQAQGFESELVIIQTLGDNQTQKPLHELGTQGIFTKALDEALLENKIDIAVHSCKDIPGEIHQDLLISAVLKREEPQDVLLSLKDSIHLENQSQRFIIGTSSVRRVAFLRHYFHQHIIKDIRGNLDTRIQKLENGEYDALILAYAGVKRMGLEKYIRQKLSKEVIVPAVGQGAVAIMIRKEDKSHFEITQRINHEQTFQEVSCERSFLKTIRGGCQLPVFGFARVFKDSIQLLAGVASVDGKQIIKKELTDYVQNAQQLGINLGNTILNEGGKELIYVSKS
ncbi:MAG: porphobilinogen deaminase [Bacteroidia bacterium]|nr:MAG: porphobilinogen deaminase [Bacteroidia bacterium]